MSPDHAKPAVLDTFGRPLKSLRLSVTDRCNLRCLYCMPEEEYVWLPREKLLSFEELAKLTGVFTSLGVDNVRLTGGEPLLRHDLDRLVAMLGANAFIEDLALTTNGVLLDVQAESLKRAGLTRLTVSLDTLKPDRFRDMTRRDDHARVLAGIEAAACAGFTRTKLDTVVMRGINDDELADLLEFGRTRDIEVRFIEYMDVPGATRWSPAGVISREQMLEQLARRYGKITSVSEETSAPAQRFRLPDGAVFGIIASTTAPFCSRCDRSRLTADGMWYRCLYATEGTDLRGPLRVGSSPETLAALITGAWEKRADRGAEVRKAQHTRGAFIALEELRRDPHLEMHTRGG
jgi:cyclic pyranopterin phosphate synthase